MKYSNYIGIAAAVALIAFCFVPWVYISSIQTTVTGLDTGHTNFGKPGVVHIFFCVFSIILFLTPKVWAKRTNLLVASFNFVWAIRNFLVITLCQMGECPEKKTGIYAVFILSFILMLMAFLPKMEVSD
jgi:uncharacterized membrane protein